jgi:mRNA-degrading endonuclease YafQ of YafQ-DinJ toxin-antitoxin module
MKKIVQRTKGFEKAFLKLQVKWRNKFVKQLELFLDDEFHPLLKTHELKGDRRGDWSFSVANDIRAIYRKEITDGKTIIIFRFIDIGSHSKVY